MKVRARLKKIFVLLAILTLSLIAWPTRTLSDTAESETNKSSDNATATPAAPQTPPPAAPATTDLPQPSPYIESYYDVRMNGALMEESVMTLIDKNGSIWLPEASLKNWNFKTDRLKPITYVDTKFVNISQIPGITSKTDDLTLALNLSTPIESFKPQKVDAGGSIIVDPTVPPWGGYFNYDIVTRNISNQTNINSAFDINIFSPYGYGYSSFNYTTQKVVRPLVRLLTAWVIDYPADMQSLAFGDNVSTSTNWSGSLNYGGFKYRRNFGTQPQFIKYPLPSYQGAAIVPSALDLYVNNAMVGQHDISAGPFDITNIPMVDGAGNLVILVKDILGRNQIYKANFYLSTQLLKEGLSDFSYDVGLIRQELGVRSNVYSQFIGTATYAYGLSDALTAQLHGEVLSYEQAAGLTLAYQLGQFGPITGTIAGSQSLDLGKGALGAFTFQRLTQTYSFGGSAQFTTEDFTQSGQAQGVKSPKLLLQLFGGVPFGNSSVSFNWTRQLSREGAQSTNLLTGTYTTTFFNAISLSFTLIRALGATPNQSAFLALNYSFDELTSMNARHTDTNGSTQNSLQLIRQLPVGPGYGYDVTLNEGATDSKVGSFSYQTDYGTYILQANKTEGDSGTSTYTLDASGSFIYIDKFFKLSRTVTNSFGLVEIKGFPNIQVYSQGQLIGITDKDGVTFVPNLLAFQPTPVYLDPNSVPLDTEIETFEKNVIPYQNSGILIPFRVKPIHNVTMTLKRSTGDLVPEGSIVILKDNDSQFLVGLSGQLFLTGVGDRVEAQAKWSDGACNFSANIPSSTKDNPLPDIGTITCTVITTPPATEAKPEKSTFNPAPTDQPIAPVTSTTPATPATAPTTTSTPSATSASINATIDSVQRYIKDGKNQAISHAVKSATLAKKQVSQYHPLYRQEAAIIMRIIQEGKYRAIATAVNYATR